MLAMPSANEQLADQFCESAAVMHAAMAQLVRLAVELDDSGGWQGFGFRSCAHWLTIHAGYSIATGEEMLRIGHAVQKLDHIAGEFDAGRLSLDKVRALTRVATPADQDLWLEIAVAASASQLSRICREYRRAMDVDAAGRDERQHAQRCLRTWWDDDGMLVLRGVLPPEDGAIVQAALEAAMKRNPRPASPPAPAGPVPDPADDPPAARRADALVALCDDSLRATTSAIDTDSDPTTPSGTQPPRRMVVHVDVGVLTGDQPDGRCHIEAGPPLSNTLARRLGCDTEILAITERDGTAIDVGRARRIVPTRLRRALESRDRTCCFPGCMVPAHRTEAHHRVHWAHGGRTDLDNLVSLCGFHHARLHEEAFTIAGTGATLRFIARDGRTIEPPQPPPPVTDPLSGLRAYAAQRGYTITPDTPAATDRGGPYDLELAVWAMCGACETRNRAGPGA